MISFVRYLFHKFIPDPKIGQVWKCDDFSNIIITLSDIKDGRVEYIIYQVMVLYQKNTINISVI